jgi:TonB-linked SusC/RagA family outer membrane protein
MLCFMGNLPLCFVKGAKQLLSLTLFLLFSYFVIAQTKVGGKVTGPDGKPVFGATVSVKGTNLATTTGTDGSYSITMPRNTGVLIISFVGYEVSEINVRGNNLIDVAMKLQTTNLNEVVVTGYTSQRVKEITGAVAIVKVKDLVSVPSGQISEMLQGRVAGLNVVNTGQPGQGAQISLTGVGNFGDVTPLYIIDGVPGDVNNLNPNDVETVQVLKDAGSAAIYGVRGANGVIIITTKKGKVGRAIVTYDAYVGTQRPLKDGWGLLGTRGRADLYDLAVANTPLAIHNNAQYGPGPTATIPYYILAGNNNGVTDPNDPAADLSLYNNDYAAGPIYLIVKANQTGTDWFHEVFKPAFQQNHTLTVSGGNDKNHYLFSAGYLNQKGTFLGTYLKRYTIRLNTDFTVKNNIHIGENLQTIYRDNPKTAIIGETNIGNTYREQPIIPVYDEGGGYGGDAGAGLGNASNPVAVAARGLDDKGYDLGVFGNVYAQVDFAKYFAIKTSFGGNFDNFYYYNYGYHSYENAENNSSNGFSENAGFNRNWTWTNTLTFNKIFLSNHSVKVLVGTESISNYGRGVGGNRFNYFLNDPNYRILSNGSPTGQTNYSYADQSALYSILSRLDYGYKDKYLLAATFRRDGSSVFGPKSRYGNFPSFSAAWRVTEEDFARNISWLTDLKIRGSWGKLGFAGNTNPLNQFTLFTADPGTSYYDIGGSSTSTTLGFRADRIGNPATGWQEDKKTNVGLDAVLYKGRLTFSADYYNKKSTKLLFQLALPAVLGGATPPNVNIGDVDNHGFDLAIGSGGNIHKDWRYDVGATLTTYHNNIVSIPGINYFYDGGLRNGNAVRNEVGHPISAFYGYKVVGLFQDAASAAASNQQDAAPGRFIYADINGDKTINDDDRTYIGNPNPNFSLGLNISVSYKNFDFTTFMYGTFGNDIFNYTKYWIDFYQGFEGGKSTRSLNESWTPTRKGNTVPIQEFTSNFSSDGAVNSYYIEDGTYFRNKSMILGYSLPASILQKARIDKLRIYVQATNLFTFTKYSGLDPEVQGYTSATGIDWGNYPANQKQYLVGINVTF